MVSTYTCELPLPRTLKIVSIIDTCLGMLSCPVRVPTDMRELPLCSLCRSNPGHGHYQINAVASIVGGFLLCISASQAFNLIFFAAFAFASASLVGSPSRN